MLRDYSAVTRSYGRGSETVNRRKCSVSVTEPILSGHEMVHQKRHRVFALQRTRNQSWTLTILGHPGPSVALVHLSFSSQLIKVPYALCQTSVENHTGSVATWAADWCPSMVYLLVKRYAKLCNSWDTPNHWNTISTLFIIICSGSFSDFSACWLKNPLTGATPSCASCTTPVLQLHSAVKPPTLCTTLISFVWLSSGLAKPDIEDARDIQKHKCGHGAGKKKNMPMLAWHRIRFRKRKLPIATQAEAIGRRVTLALSSAVLHWQYFKLS